MKTLVLFDIDGTLVLTGHAGLRALDRAFRDVLGLADALGQVAFAGRTDRAIISEALDKAGRRVDDETYLAVRDRYCEYLAAEVGVSSEHPRCVLPGIETTLDHLAPLEADGRVAVGLLTGNFARGAEIKLSYFDLWRRFRFGAYGDHHVDRRDLVPLAIDAAARAGVGQFSPAETVIVGDTPADVDCAHAHGAKAVAVATGMFTEDQLRETGAEVVVRDLSNWPAIWFALYPLSPNQ